MTGVFLKYCLSACCFNIIFNIILLFLLLQQKGMKLPTPSFSLSAPVSQLIP